MLVEVTDGRRTTYRYRHKLSYFGLKPKGRKWTLTTSDNDIVDYINSFYRSTHSDLHGPMKKLSEWWN